MDLHPHIAQILAGFMPPALRLCNEPALCNNCSGSGEGFTENSTCWACKGMGEVVVQS